MLGRVHGVVVQATKETSGSSMRETDDDFWVRDILVVQAGLEIGQRRVADGGIRHDLVSLVDEILFPQRLEDPPYALHVPRLHGLVIILEIDPAAEASDGGLLFAVPGDDAAGLVVRANAHFLTSSFPLMPSFLSISYSTGKPWQSHPKRLSTWWPVWWAYLVMVSLIVPRKDVSIAGMGGTI